LVKRRKYVALAALGQPNAPTSFRGAEPSLRPAGSRMLAGHPPHRGQGWDCIDAEPNLLRDCLVAAGPNSASIVA